MNRFDDIKLAWDGRTYTIPSRAVMGAIARVEDVVTLEELRQYTQRRAVPLAKISMAYGAVLRYAGADVDDEAVYASMFSDGGADRAMDAVLGLLRLMLPNDPGLEDRVREAAAQGNSRPTAAASSRKHIKQRSGKAG